LGGAVNSLLTFLPRITAHGEGGHVVNTSSMSGLRVRPGKGQGIYATTKSGIIGMSEALRLDLEGTGVGVSVLCPDPVASRIYEAGRNRPKIYGGHFIRPAGDPLKRSDNDGHSADAVGRRVRLAVEEEDFYIVTERPVSDRFATPVELSRAFYIFYLLIDGSNHLELGPPKSILSRGTFNLNRFIFF
jgi:NAD(P)-dependent dehydrogenase (short-subunit alcohol dehydrogenase family)